MASLITDTVFIFGKSNFIKQVDIQRLLNLGYTTFAINDNYFETDFVVFVDDYVAKQHESLKGTIITQSRHAVREPFIHFDNFSYNFTHDYLLKWLHGRCTRAILIGVADFIDDKKYDSNFAFKPSINSIKRSIKYIEEIKDIEIFKLNPNGVLQVPIMPNSSEYILSEELIRL